MSSAFLPKKKTVYKPDVISHMFFFLGLPYLITKSPVKFRQKVPPVEKVMLDFLTFTSLLWVILSDYGHLTLFLDFSTLHMPNYAHIML